MPIMSVEVSYKKQFVFYTLFLFILLFAIELGAKVFDWQQNYDQPPCDFIGNTALKNIEETAQYQICKDHNSLKYLVDGILKFVPNQHMETIDINSHGFRGPEFSEEKQSDVYRVFFVGGSTSFGAASSESDTIPTLIQNEINNLDTGLKIEIINAGISSAYSFTEKYLIQNDLAKFQPDLIIIYSGGNDSHNRYNETYHPHTVSSNQTNISPTFIQVIKKIITDVDYKTPIILSKILTNVSNVIPVSESSKNQVQELWTTRMNETCNTNNDLGIETIVFVQPMLGSGDKQLSDSEKIEILKYNDIYNYHPVTLEILNNMADSLNTLETTCDAVYDLTLIYDDIDETIYLDWIHTNYLGNKIIANEIYPIIITQIMSNHTDG
jgi:lysophospholipase L1-like esterase